MNSKLHKFERHLKFTAVILLQQSRGFVVLIILCYHAGTIKEANINNRTGRLLTVLLQIFRQCTINAFINASSMNSSMHSSMHHQCTINAFINVSSMHSLLHLSMHPQCAINALPMYSLHQMHQFRSFSSYFHHQCIYQCITNVFINASSMQSINASSMLH